MFTTEHDVPTFSSKGRLVRVPRRMSKFTGDVVEVFHDDGCTAVCLGEMVPFEQNRMMDTTSRFEYEEVAC